MFDKLEFLAACQSFCKQTFKFNTFQHTFKSTGLVAFNLDLVLDKTHKKNKL